MTTARRYEHAGLDQPVVRLVPEILAPAADTTYGLLGLRLARSVDVGEGSHDSVGFLNWVLLNDPDNAEHALAVADQLGWVHGHPKNQAYVAARKVAKNYRRLAEQFAATLPHFIPPLYEEAARITASHGETLTAYYLFNDARAAEAEHNLPVDHAALSESFVEFAHADVVTAQTMTDYSKALALQKPPDAFERFLRLCVDWVRSGLKPYPNMWQDLRDLADAVDRHAADYAFLAAVLDTPAISKAKAKFWQAYQPSIVELARQDADIRRRLLSFAPSDDKVDKLIDTWVDILTDSGAIDELQRPAEWLSMAITAWHRARRSEKWLDLVATLAPRLRADGAPVVVRSYVMNIDLADLLVAENVPIRIEQSDFQFEVWAWVDDKRRGRRDMVALAADPRLGPILTEAVIDYHSEHYWDHTEAHQLLISQTPGMAKAKHDWVHGLPACTTDLALPGLDDLLHKIGKFSVKDYPDVADQLAATDIAEALALTLRGGVWDEFGWSALEEAVIKLLGSTKVADGDESPVWLSGHGWPALVLQRKSSAIVVGPDGILLEHALKIPAEDKKTAYYEQSTYYVDGQLLVVWRGGPGTVAYWSDKPKATFVVERKKKHPTWYDYPFHHLTLPLGDGQFTGHQVLRAGDTELPKRGHPVSDGTRCWFRDWYPERYVGYRWRAVDPETGETGELTLPEFLESFEAEGTTLELGASDLRPAAPGTEGSLLGCVNGLHGLRVRQETDGSWLAERIDGGQVRLPASERSPDVAIRFPGDSAPRAVVGNGSYDMFDPDGRKIAHFWEQHRHQMARGTMVVPPKEWWHCLRVRDEAGSLALRGVTREAAARLLAGEPLSDVLPEITHPELARGVLGIVEYAAGLAVEFERFKNA